MLKKPANNLGIQPPDMALPQLSLALPQDLVDKIINTQEATVSKTTQADDATLHTRRLHEFLNFCESLGIKSSNAFPAKEELLVAWAASYSGRLAGGTVTAKIGAIKKEHERRGLVWQGGVLLRRILKGVEELRPSSKKGRRTSKPEDLTEAGDVKPAAPKVESDDSSQSDDGDDDVKAHPVITIEDSSESDSDCDVEMVDTVSAANDCEYHSHTFGQIVICLCQRTSARLQMMHNLKPKR